MSPRIALAFGLTFGLLSSLSPAWADAAPAPAAQENPGKAAPPAQPPSPFVSVPLMLPSSIHAVQRAKQQIIAAQEHLARTVGDERATPFGFGTRPLELTKPQFRNESALYRKSPKGSRRQVGYTLEVKAS